MSPIADGTVGVRQATAPDRPIDNDTDGSKYRQKVWDAGPIGTWGYNAGTSGTVTLTGGKRLLSAAVHASSVASMTINGGDSIPIPANVAFDVTPKMSLTDPTLVFTGSDSFFVEWVI